MVLARCIVYTDAMDMMSASTEDLLAERIRLKDRRSFAWKCDDLDWSEDLTHRIYMIDVELMKRVDAIR